jgi:SAM-dependent methyltransferase
LAELNWISQRTDASGIVFHAKIFIMRSRLSLILLLLKQGFDPGAIVTRLALRKALEGCDSVLDVGCGTSMNLRWLGIKHPVGMEGHPPTLEKARHKNTHDELVSGDVRALDQHFKPGQFDACIAMDVIEHLPKEDGFKMMEQMEKIARRKVVFLTPSGFLPQHSFDNNDLQEHLSGWEASEMEQRGYQVIGLLGPKGMRGEQHVLKGRPRVFWGLVSLLGHIFWTHCRPEKAAAILCVKTKK